MKSTLKRGNCECRNCVFVSPIRVATCFKWMWLIEVLPENCSQESKRDCWILKRVIHFHVIKTTNAFSFFLFSLWLLNLFLLLLSLEAHLTFGVFYCVQASDWERKKDVFSFFKCQNVINSHLHESSQFLKTSGRFPSECFSRRSVKKQLILSCKIYLLW